MYEVLMVLKNLAIYIIGIFTGILLSIVLFQRMEKMRKTIFYVIISVLILISCMLSFNIALP